MFRRSNLLERSLRFQRKMYIFKTYLFFIFVSGYFSLPVEDEDAIVITNEIDNTIDDGDIDLSSLEPHAFGIPKNESGKNY